MFVSIIKLMIVAVTMRHSLTHLLTHSLTHSLTQEAREEINNLALVKGHSSALSNIHNFISIDKFKEKTYQGLLPDITPEIKEQNNQIVAGLHGTASGYDKK